MFLVSLLATFLFNRRQSVTPTGSIPVGRVGSLEETL